MLAVVGEFDALNGGQVVPGLEQLAGLDFPHAHRAVGAAGREEGGGRVDVDGPEGALVAFVGAEALAVGAVPGAHDMVFADGEEEIAFLGESVRVMLVTDRPVYRDGGRWRILDLGERTLVAGKQYRSHICCAVLCIGQTSPPPDVVGCSRGSTFLPRLRSRLEMTGRDCTAAGRISPPSAFGGDLLKHSSNAGQ